MPPLVPVACAYLLMSVFTFTTFAIDKHLAQRGVRRVPERTLHVLSLLGGVGGAMAAMALVRHKNRKIGFVCVTLVIATAHVGGWIAWWTVRARG